MLDYIDKITPSYNITIYIEQDEDESRYLDLYCHWIQIAQDGSRDSNQQKSHLWITFYHFLKELQDGNHPDSKNIIIFKNYKRLSAGVHGVIGRKMYCYIVAGAGSFTRLSKVQRLLHHRNDQISAITLTLTTDPYSPSVDTEIASYLLEVKDYGKCQQLCISRGMFMNMLVMSENES